MIEIWKQLQGWQYEVSNLGNIKRIGGKVIKSQQINKGYCYVDLWDKNKRWNAKVHRLVAKVFIPNLNNFKEINHKDGNKLNNKTSNLEWCTRLFNIRHAFKNGLRQPTRGEKAGNSKLLTYDVLKIRKMVKGGMARKDIAKMFNIGVSTVAHICLRTRWAFLK
ncbi:MAG: hypothetical protein NVSMB66_6380 [Candidatus Doudnabacteria bacterium]